MGEERGEPRHDVPAQGASHLVCLGIIVLYPMELLITLCPMELLV